MGVVGDFELRVMGEERATFVLNEPKIEGYTLGRSDSESEYLPDIDLSKFGGRELGVSRRHAALVRYNDAVHVLDLSSVNGTFLNGTRLLADTPYLVQFGDSVKLGNLTLTIMPQRHK
jgi:pSer/pThr/pTyr-binding forkhead associated (FHA) protein